MDVAPIRVLRRRCCSSQLIYLLLLGLMLPLIAHRLALLPTGYINIEYLLIGGCSLFLRRGVGFSLLALDSFADFAYSIAYTYSLSPRALLHSIRSLDSLPAGRILQLVAVSALIIVACAVAACARPRSGDRLWVAGSLLLLILLVTSAALLTGESPFKQADLIPAHGRLLRAPALSFARFEGHLHTVDMASYRTDNGGLDSASSHAIALLGRPGDVESPNVVLILVESWGYPLDQHLARAIDAAYDGTRIGRNYDISRGSVPFRGSTIPAEARELCQSRMGFNILVAPPKSLLGCLPAVFHARGYQNLSVHGYLGSMFQRNTWYPQIGFDRSWFHAELKQLKLPDCDGAFPGTCDAGIAGWIGTSLLSEDIGKPRFIYWVTLNSHLPVPAHPDLGPDPEKDGACSALPQLLDSVPLCSWFRLVRNVHQAVQQLALRPHARPTVFVIVGDHAPPFADPKLRQIFSAAEVPYVILTPRRVASR